MEKEVGDQHVFLFCGNKWLEWVAEKAGFQLD